MTALTAGVSGPPKTVRPHRSRHLKEFSLPPSDRVIPHLDHSEGLLIIEFDLRVCRQFLAMCFAPNSWMKRSMLNRSITQQQRSTLRSPRISFLEILSGCSITRLGEFNTAP